jgi:hypothetical protein
MQSEVTWLLNCKSNSSPQDNWGINYLKTPSQVSFNLKAGDLNLQLKVPDYQELPMQPERVSINFQFYKTNIHYSGSIFCFSNRHILSCEPIFINSELLKSSQYSLAHRTLEFQIT